jgi:uncharacterized repeat protein (TIGR01451 family)
MRLFQGTTRAAATQRRQRRNWRPLLEAFEERLLLSNIPFDPTGGGGANPANVLNVSSVAWLPGNVLTEGGGSLFVGKDIPALYEAILGSINTASGNSASTLGNNGSILINGNPTNVQIVITAQFHETVTSITNTGPNTVVTFAPNFAAGTNEVKIYAQEATTAENVTPALGNAANRNDSSGKGFAPQPVPSNSTLILTGHITTTGFTSSFVQNNTAGSSALLNQHGGGSGSYSGVNTITGSGNTSLTVAVNSYNHSYFLPPSGTTLSTLNFDSITSGVPFRAVDPQTKMFDGTVPNVGTVNGNGTDFLFQSQANNDFTLGTPLPQVDLAITKTDGTPTYTPGTSTTYTIVVSNNGPSNVTGATIVDTLPAQGTGTNWTFVSATGGATVTGASSGTGALSTTANMPNGSTLTFTETVLFASAATGPQTNTVTVQPPAGVTDTNPTNNTATDTDTPNPPQNGNLPLTWGYWKTHDGYGPQADAWPTGTFGLGDGVIYMGAVDGQGRAASSITFGGHTYTFSELQTILGTSVGGDALINLGHQLIAAILNVANGAGTPAAVTLIHQASDALLTTNPLNTSGHNLLIGVDSVTNKTNKALYNQLVGLAASLDAFNSSGV